jgi:hypothetical protein
MPSPLQTTQQADANEYQREVVSNQIDGSFAKAQQNVLPSFQEIQRAMQVQALESMQRRMMLQPQLNEEADTRYDTAVQQLQPREFSGDDWWNSIATAKGGSTLGETLANMGASVAGGRMARDKENRAAAIQLAELAEKRSLNNQKDMFEGMARIRDASGTAKPEFTLPDGTPVYKAGTRLVTVGPEGKAQEWLGAEKTVIGGDTLLNQRSAMVNNLTKYFVEETKLPLEEAARRAEALADAQFSQVLGKTGVGERPMTPAAATPTTTGSKIEEEAPGAKFQIDTTGWTDDQKAAVRGQIEAYKKNPTPATQARLEATLARVGGVQPAEVSTETTPRKDRVQEAYDKKAAERRAEAESEAKIKSEAEIGKAEGTRAGAKPEEINALRGALSAIDRLETAVAETSGLPGMEKVHGLSGYIPLVGDVATARGTEAQDYKSKLKTLKAQIGFQVLADMRAASKTGGALGAITEKELDFLQNALDSLDTEMSDEAAKKSYENILGIVRKMRSNLTEAFITKYPTDAKSPTQGAVPPSSETKTVGGTVYEKRADGKWYPK